MEDVQGTSANRFATIADLQKLLHTVRTKYARLSATNNSKHHTLHVVETNNDIQALYQEIV